MNLNELLAMEFQQEAAATRKMLERVPQESFTWKPHEKSMTLGQLAAHVANLHGTWCHTTLSADEYDLATGGPPPAGDVASILENFDEHVSQAIELLREQTDEQLSSAWRLRRGPQVFFEIPRHAVIRSMVLNHIVHHRGQLSVYLRLLNVPLPPTYGPSADEAPSF